MLSTTQIEHFRQEGYVVVPKFFPEDEVAALRSEVNRMYAEGLMENVSTLDDNKTENQQEQNLQLIPLDIHSGLFRALPFEPKVMQSVGQLLGDEVVKILDQLFMKPAKTGLGTNWHTDNAYFRIRDALAGTAMWIAIDDANRENGTLKVVPRAFGTQHKHFRDPQSSHHIRMQALDDEAVHCELKAGGVVFFCYGTPHATGPNLTNSTRTGVGLHFVNADYINPDGVAQEQPNQIQLTGKGADGGMAKYGLDLRGSWDAELEKVMSSR